MFVDGNIWFNNCDVIVNINVCGIKIKNIVMFRKYMFFFIFGWNIWLLCFFIEYICVEFFIIKFFIVIDISYNFGVFIKVFFIVNV